MKWPTPKQQQRKQPKKKLNYHQFWPPRRSLPLLPQLKNRGKNFTRSEASSVAQGLEE